MIRIPPSLTDVLWEFSGNCGLVKAQNAVAHIEWLRNELKISQYNEKAAYAVLEQVQAELFELRTKLRQEAA